MNLKCSAHEHIFKFMLTTRTVQKMKIPKAITLYPKIPALFSQSLLLENCPGTPCRILFFLNLTFHQKNLFLRWLEILHFFSPKNQSWTFESSDLCTGMKPQEIPKREKCSNFSHQHLMAECIWNIPGLALIMPPSHHRAYTKPSKRIFGEWIGDPRKTDST